MVCFFSEPGRCSEAGRTVGLFVRFLIGEPETRVCVCVSVCLSIWRAWDEDMSGEWTGTRVCVCVSGGPGMTVCMCLDVSEASLLTLWFSYVWYVCDYIIIAF